MFCRSCGKQIETEARFCRFCGARQQEGAGATASPAGSGGTGGPAGRSRGMSLEERLRRVFPRHHLQDEFMHIGTIVAFVVAVVGFVFGLFIQTSYLGTTWLLFAIALLLFLMLRESTISHLRTRDRSDMVTGDRHHAGRRSASSSPPAEAVTAESSPPPAPR